MKLDGEKKISKTEKHSESVDLVAKQAVHTLGSIKIDGFKSSQVWSKISDRLGSLDKRYVTWGLAMAASFSLLVASNLQMGLFNIDLTLAESTILEIYSNPSESAKTESSSKENLTKSIRTIHPITLVSVVKPEHNKIQVEPLKRIENNQLPSLKKSSTADLTPLLSNPFVSFNAKVNVTTNSISPEFEIDFKIKENYTKNRRKIISLGVSTQLTYLNTIEGKKKITPHSFISLQYSNLNKKSNKGWTSRVGYLLNPDSNFYQDATIKVSVFRNLGKHFKIGPEVIFTDNMKKIYPRISLVLG